MLKIHTKHASDALVSIIGGFSCVSDNRSSQMNDTVHLRGWRGWCMWHHWFFWSASGVIIRLDKDHALDWLHFTRLQLQYLATMVISPTSDTVVNKCLEILSWILHFSGKDRLESVQSAITQPHRLQSEVLNCALWHLSITASSKPFNILCYSKLFYCLLVVLPC